eukprot:863468-Amphidinium_carterae.1
MMRWQSCWTIGRSMVRLLRLWCSQGIRNPIEASAPPVLPQPTTTADPLKTKKVKMSLILDPADEAEVPLCDSAMRKQWRENHTARIGGPPFEEHEPTIEMVSAMHARVI